MSRQEALDKKWEVVERYYSQAYKIKFKERLSEKNVEFLYNEMKKLKDSLQDHYDKARNYLDTLN